MRQHYKPQTLWACPTNLSPWLGGLQLRDIRGEHCASAGCCAHAVMMASTNVALHVSKLTKKTGRTNANKRSAIAWSSSIKRAAGLCICWSNVVWSCCQQLSNELSNYPKQVYDLNCCVKVLRFEQQKSIACSFEEVRRTLLAKEAMRSSCTLLPHIAFVGWTPNAKWDAEIKNNTYNSFPPDKPWPSKGAYVPMWTLQLYTLTT
jgi:hypothetical protein